MADDADWSTYSQYGAPLPNDKTAWMIFLATDVVLLEYLQSGSEGLPGEAWEHSGLFSFSFFQPCGSNSTKSAHSLQTKFGGTRMLRQ